jgi:PAS domain S-box-containing protein
MATILVVDDLTANRDLLVTLLRHQGHRLLEAEDGQQGLAVVRAEHTDLVITDVLMPVMDGYEFVRQLRLDPATSRIPVVFYTAHYGEREARALALSSGVSCVLTKPAEPEDVLESVRRVLAGVPATPGAPDGPLLKTEFDREHLRLVTDKLSQNVGELTSANARLRALINIGLELASERDSARLLQNVCASARDLFGATYVTLGVVSRSDRTLERLVSSGLEDGNWIKAGDELPRLMRTVVAERRTLRGDNPGGDPAGLHLPAGHPVIQAFLIAPMASPASVYGWIGLAGNEGRSFSQDDEQLLVALAGQVGRIYENGYFYAVARDERDRAQRYLDTAEVMLLALDLKGRITQVNRYACLLLGWTSDQLIGRDWVETCLPARIRATSRRQLDDAAIGDLPILQSPMLTRSGEERLIEWRNTTLRDSAGEVIGTLSSGSDITDRKRVETTLLETEARMAFALRQSHTGGWELDLDDHTTHRTLTHDQIFGYESLLPVWTYEAFLGHVVPEDRAKVDRLFNQAVELKTDWTFECRIRRVDGEIRWIWATGGYQNDGGDHPFRRLAGIVQDITDRKRAEEEVDQRARMSALSAAIGLSLTTMDSLPEALRQCAEALVTHLDAAFARIWTLNASEAVLELQASAGLYTHLNGPHGRVPVGQFKIGRIARDRKPHLTNAVVGDPEVSDQEWARATGMTAFAGHPLQVEGRVVGVMALFARHELSDTVAAALAAVADHIALGIERHRSATALRAAEERVRYALQNANVGIWDMDYTSGVLRWSETIESHYGVPPGTFAGTFDAFVDRIHPDDRDSVLETVGKAMKAGSDFTVEHRSLWPDGTVRWLSGRGRVHLGGHGEPVRAVGISIDVSERRLLEEQYRQAQKMEAVGRLAGGVAHDFNNVLGVILGSCELLMGDLAPGDPRAADVIEIRKAGERAAGLTRQLLAFSRKQIVEPSLLDLNVVAVELQPMIARLIGEDVGIVLALAPQPARVNADRGQIEQVIMNLSVNARDAMPHGGTLTIETANVMLDEDYAMLHVGVKPGRFVALVVSDTGTGMTAETQTRVFEPFFTTKEVGKGTGLGLATVHGIATGSGGSVAVYSEVGIGSSFKVYLPPADDADVVIESQPIASLPDAARQTVLLVEDADGLREVTSKLLRRRGYTVLAAANATEALALFDEQSSIDVVLTDVVMPGTSGPELTKQLVERKPDLKVIFMSGYTEDAIVQHGVLKEGIAFLSKPITSDALDRKIHEVFNR